VLFDSGSVGFMRANQWGRRINGVSPRILTF
jgi:hypothetical protein